VELISQTFGFELVENRIDAVGNDERRALLALGEKVAHRAGRGTGPFGRFALAREQGE